MPRIAPSLFFLSGIFLGIVLLHFGSVLQEDDAFASIAPTVSTPLTAALAKGDKPLLLAEVQEYAHREEFVRDVSSCRYFQQVSAIEAKNGFWLSFECVTRGDVFHPYSGFFQSAPVKQIFWGETETNS